MPRGPLPVVRCLFPVARFPLPVFLLARDVKFIKHDIHVRFENDISSVRQMLTRFIQSLGDSQSRPETDG